MAEHVIEIKGLHKAFGSHEVLRGIDFAASKGEAVEADPFAELAKDAATMAPSEPDTLTITPDL